MSKKVMIGGLLAGLALATAAARELPLQFKTLKPEELGTFPGGYGAYGSLQARRPAELWREPAAVSRHPIYGRLNAVGGKGFLFRLDESKGDGKGYDRLVLDLNGNGDLTDDLAVAPAKATSRAQALSAGREQRTFGPVAAPAGVVIAGGRPVYFAELYLANRQLLTRAAASTPQLYLGTLRFRAAWYLETAVELDGEKRKIGIYDGNANLRLGESAMARTNRINNEKQYVFPASDCFLRDADGSGKFDHNLFSTETVPFGPVLYFGDRPFQASLSADGSSLRLEPWPGPLATLMLQPSGSQVREVSLAWEQSPDQWRLIKAGVVRGQTTVPPGRYFVYNTFATADCGNGESVMVSGYNRSARNAFQAAAGQTRELRCGAPLELKMAATSQADSDSLRIRAQVLGQGGESFATFAKGRDFLAGRPAAPTFTVLGLDGAVLASGTMEYG
jgi:hypothetical protein